MGLDAASDANDAGRRLALERAGNLTDGRVGIVEDAIALVTIGTKIDLDDVVPLP